TALTGTMVFAGTSSLTSGGGSLGNVTINGSSAVTPQDAAVVSGTFLNSGGAGGFTANSQQVTLSGTAKNLTSGGSSFYTLVVSGSITAQDNTVIAQDLNVTGSLALGALALNVTGGVTFGGGTVTGTGAVDVKGGV